MRKQIFFITVLFISFVLQPQVAKAKENHKSSAKESSKPSWIEQVEKITELKGIFNEDGGVFKVSSPRNDGSRGNTGGVSFAHAPPRDDRRKRSLCHCTPRLRPKFDDHGHARRADHYGRLHQYTNLAVASTPLDASFSDRARALCHRFLWRTRTLKTLDPKSGRP